MHSGRYERADGANIDQQDMKHSTYQRLRADGNVLHQLDPHQNMWRSYQLLQRFVS